MASRKRTPRFYRPSATIAETLECADIQARQVEITRILSHLSREVEEYRRVIAHRLKRAREVMHARQRRAA